MNVVPTSEIKDYFIITSSDNNYFLCDSCGIEKQFNDKKVIEDHIRLCDKGDENHKTIAAMEEMSKTLDTKEQTQSMKTQIVNICRVCNKKFVKTSSLRYHIRRMHFNLQAKTPYYQLKKVNQIWFEKVINSNTILEIRKSRPNTLILRRLSENTAIKVHDVKTDIVDLRDIYPTCNPHTYQTCNVCRKRILKNSMLTHKLTHKSKNRGKKK